MKSSLLRSEPMAIFLMIGSSRSAADPWRYCGVTAVSSTTTPAALALARAAAAPTSSTLAAAMRARAATSSRRANSPPAMGDPSGRGVGAAAYRRLPRSAAVDLAAHDPAPLRDLAVADETEVGVERLGTGVEVRTALRLAVVDLLRVRLDGPAAGAPDLLEDRRHRGPGDASPAVLAAGEDAADAPARELVELLLVGRGVLDVRQLVGRPELAPADAPVTVVDEDLVDGLLPGVALLGLAVVLPAAAEPFGVEADAPAAAPDPVVGLDELGEVVPGLGRQEPGPVKRRLDLTHQLGVGPQ